MAMFTASSSITFSEMTVPVMEETPKTLIPVGPGVAASSVSAPLPEIRLQLAVVASIVPWLLLLSRTPVYTPLRITGACFGAAAAIGWMAERALNWPNPVGSIVDTLAHRAVWVAASARGMSVTRPAPRPSSSLT